MTEAKGVDAVDRAFQILECFDGPDDTLSLADLARQTGLYKSTILRLAVSLDRGGYMVREASGRYRLGPTLWRLGTRYRGNFDMGELIRPELRQLSDQTRESASFYVRDGERRICLYRREPERAIRHILSEGSSIPLKGGASGEVLQAWTEPNNPDFAETRARGFAVSRGAREPEVAAVAVPLLGKHNRFRGALAVSGLITRFTDSQIDAFRKALLESAARLKDATPDD